MVTIKLKSPNHYASCDLIEDDELDDIDHVNSSLHGHNLTPDTEEENSSLDLGMSFGKSSTQYYSKHLVKTVLANICSHSSSLCYLRINPC